jgi:hypothetical protein
MLQQSYCATWYQLRNLEFFKQSQAIDKYMLLCTVCIINVSEEETEFVYWDSCSSMIDAKDVWLYPARQSGQIQGLDSHQTADLPAIRVLDHNAIKTHGERSVTI